MRRYKERKNKKNGRRKKDCRKEDAKEIREKREMMVRKKEGERKTIKKGKNCEIDCREKKRKGRKRTDTNDGREERRKRRERAGDE